MMKTRTIEEEQGEMLTDNLRGNICYNGSQRGWLSTAEPNHKVIGSYHPHLMA